MDKKRLMSKWTAAHPQNKEKHFLVTDIVKDDHGNITQCLLQAVHSGHEYWVESGQLSDRQHWLPGWNPTQPAAE